MNTLSRLVLLFLLLARLARAEIRVPAILGNNMVLQRNVTINLWGWCEPAEKISISVGWSSAPIQVTGNNGAKWNAKIETPDAGGPPRLLQSAHSRASPCSILRW